MIPGGCLKFFFSDTPPMGGCKSKFSSLLNPIFPFVQNSRPGGGGGANRKKRRVHPPTGGVLDPPAGESKDPHWGGVEIQIEKIKKITMEKIEKIGVPSHPPCGGSRLGGVSPNSRGSMDPHWGGLEISLPHRHVLSIKTESSRRVRVDCLEP